MMRDKAYYLRILEYSPPYARISITLAAAMVYAALYGECELEHRRTDEFKAIAQQLKSRYGYALSVEKVREKINAVDSKEIP
jgi:hypothetical protein